MVGIKVLGEEYEFYFHVEDTDENLLGLNFLKLMSTIIDLQNLTLTVRKAVAGTPILPSVTVNVEGQDVVAKVDTACTFDMIGPLSVAQELGLSLKPCNVRVLGHGSLFSNCKQYANGLRFEACG